MDAISTGKTRACSSPPASMNARTRAYCGGGLPASPTPTPIGTSPNAEPRTPPNSPSPTSPAHPHPHPPFSAPASSTTSPSNNIFPYIDEVALFRGQWQFKSGDHVRRDDFRSRPKKPSAPSSTASNNKSVDSRHPPARGRLRLLPLPIADNKRPRHLRSRPATAAPPTEERLRFRFPRQPGGSALVRLRLLPPRKHHIRTSSRIIRLRRASPSNCVTMGNRHGLYEDAESSANTTTTPNTSTSTAWASESPKPSPSSGTNASARSSASPCNDAPHIRRTLLLPLPGRRYSFGYPACPDLEDQTKLFQAPPPRAHRLRPHRKLHASPPNSPPRRLITHHPQAKYFNVE